MGQGCYSMFHSLDVEVLSGGTFPLINYLVDIPQIIEYLIPIPKPWVTTNSGYELLNILSHVA